LTHRGGFSSLFFVRFDFFAMLGGTGMMCVVRRVTLGLFVSLGIAMAAIMVLESTSSGGDEDES